MHEVRGRGLMIGIEFRRPRSVRLRAQWTLLETMRTGLFTQLVVVPLFRDHGILTQVAGDHQNVLKILPPLITTDEQADAFVDALDDVLDEPRALARPAVRRRPLARDPGDQKGPLAMTDKSAFTRRRIGRRSSGGAAVGDAGAVRGG